MQRRITDFNSLVTAEKLNTAHRTMSVPGILSGGVLEVLGTNSLKLNPLSFITPDGVIVIEDAAQTIEFSLGLVAKNYTIIYRHLNEQVTGGSLASIEVLDGLLAQSEFTDATIVGWLKYTGNSDILADSMIYQPRPLQVTGSFSQDKITAPLTYQWIDGAPAPLIAVTEVLDSDGAYTKFFNTSPSIVFNTVKYLPLVVGQFKPQILNVRVRAEYQASLVVTVFDEFGTEYFPTNNAVAYTYDIVTSQVIFQNFVMTLPNLNGSAGFNPGSQYYLKFTTQLNPLKSVSLQRILISDYNLPV